MKILLLSAFILSLCSCKSETKERDIPSKTLDRDSTYYQVALLIMDGVYNTELTAPMDIFQHTRYREGIKAMQVFTVAQEVKEIISFEGLRIIPDYSFTNHPAIDILVVPSAEHHLDSDLDNITLIDWVKKVDKDALFVTSHCDGAFILAKAGLLDSYYSTTFPSDVQAYKEMFPQLRVKEDVLFVHDGKYITSAGGARSFDAALYLCEHLYGPEVAKRLAGGLVIDWNLDEVAHFTNEN